MYIFYVEVMGSDGIAHILQDGAEKLASVTLRQKRFGSSLYVLCVQLNDLWLNGYKKYRQERGNISDPTRIPPT
jgi:hypothetical protein